jgi:hypothetical protein
MTFEASMKKLFEDIARIYIGDPDQVLSCLSTESVTGCINECYQIYVREKELIPLDELEESEKRRLWDESIKYCCTKKGRVMVARSIYLLEKMKIKDEE